MMFTKRDSIFYLFVFFYFCSQFSEAQSQTNSVANTGSSPVLVTKVYPDGTRTLVRWVDLGSEIDKGEKHGGAPVIEVFDPKTAGLTSLNSSDQSLSPMSSSANQTDQNKSLVYAKGPEEYNPDDLYGRFQLGITFVTDQSVKNVDSITTTTNLTFDPGLRGVLEIGGDLMEYLALEGNIGASWNTCNQGSSAALFQIPAQIGLLGQYPIEVDHGPRLLPYFGLDAGLSAMLYQDLSFVPQGQTATYTGSPSYLTPIWQIRTGVMIEVQRDWSLVLGYTFFGTWGSLGTNSNIDLGFVGTSSLDIGMRVNF